MGTVVNDDFIVEFLVKVLRRGPLPITVLGTHVQEFDSSLPFYIKKEYRGLKKLLERHGEIFVVKDCLVSLNCQAMNGMNGGGRGELDEFIGAALVAVLRGQYYRLGRQLRLFDDVGPFKLGLELNRLGLTSDDKFMSFLDKFPANFARIVCLHLKICVLMILDVALALPVLQEQMSIFWGFCDDTMLAVLMVMCKNLRVIARTLDVSSGLSGGRNDEKSRNVSVYLRSLIASNNKNKDEEQSVNLVILSSLLRIAFSTRTVGSCRALLNLFPCELEIPSNCVFVTIKYFLGRYYTYEGFYRKADESFNMAYGICKKSYSSNVRVILRYWLPVAAIFGKFPTEEALKHYNLKPLSPFFNSIKLGDVEAFNNFRFTKKYGLQFHCLIAELTLIVYRNLLKRVYLILGSNRMKLKIFQTALSFSSGRHVEIAEAQTILATLISKGLTKAYISDRHQAIVFSNSEQFPPTFKMAHRTRNNMTDKFTTPCTPQR